MVKIYIEDSRGMADSKIYFEKSRGMADLIVFFEDSRGMAKWHRSNKFRGRIG
jgi:hypothetical protein|tara:strand:+ start:704 stop:862 length:159 start_codon:yes stop_codon:yes gene_type:complete